MRSASNKFPKNFHPVGTSKKLMFNLAQTWSKAPEVGILRAAPEIL